MKLKEVLSTIKKCDIPNLQNYSTLQKINTKELYLQDIHWVRFGGCNENIKNTLYLLDYILYNIYECDTYAL